MNDCHLGRQIAGLLLARMGQMGLTFAQVAERAGVPETWVRRALLRGAAGKGMHTLPIAYIAHFLDCEIEFRLVPKEAER